MSYVPVYSAPRQHQMAGWWDAHFGDDPTTEFKADVSAIAEYLSREPIKTAAAEAKRDEFIRWRDTIGDCDRICYDHARNLKQQFEDLNTTSQAEREALAKFRKTALTTEEMQAEAKRQDSGGKYSETAPPGASLPLWAKMAIGFGIAGVGIYALHETRMFVSLFKKAPKAS